jgi:hypothetical protein
MIDVNRIRERAAGWLGDVGDAALDFGSRVFQWHYYRLTGDVRSICQRTIGLAPSLQWVFTGSGERRVGPDIGDAFTRGVRQAEEVIYRDDDSDDELRARIMARREGDQAAASYACGDSDCRMVGQEQNRAGACPACWRELDALPDEDAATDPA